ncbi:MAG: mercury methylation corrinoid protein HgcA [Desulfobacterales bacterium]
MTKSPNAEDSCCLMAASSCDCVSFSKPSPIGERLPSVSCCVQPAGTRHSEEIPGYALWHFVETFQETPAGRVPEIRTAWSRQDWTGAAAARIGIGRLRYRIAPGLYAVGRPGPESAVIVTANYKLTFDILRRALSGRDLWILVLDTHGINVWCAAGKGTFSTDEIIHRVKETGLEGVVSHRRLIVPQLGATGVAAHKVSNGCGFKVVWGPIRAEDLPAFLDAGMAASPAMRQVTFGLMERLVLVPVEINNLAKPFLWLILSVFVLSGLGSGFFSFSAAAARSGMALSAAVAGVAAGAVAAPLLLPWLPGRAFALKGAFTGVGAGLLVLLWQWRHAAALELPALFLFTVAVSSFLAMNFTGSTPFTSPTGVETEMRKAIPLQAAALGVAALAWIGAGF